MCAGSTPALSGHNDARAEFARLHNCPLIVKERALITKRYRELTGLKRIMSNLVGRIGKGEHFLDLVKWVSVVRGTTETAFGIFLLLSLLGH